MTEILFLASNPLGTTHLALDEECREIQQKIRSAEHRDSLVLVTRWAVRPDDLLQHLNERKPQIVHFSGHGAPEEEIVLTDRNRNPKPVSTRALKQLFTTLKDNIRLVVLNACFSRAQAQAITEVIDCAVGMNRAIGDQAAITFASAFYRAIGFGRSVQEAFDQGKTALMLEGIAEEHIPELLVRSGVDPSRVILIPDSTKNNQGENAPLPGGHPNATALDSYKNKARALCEQGVSKFQRRNKFLYGEFIPLRCTRGRLGSGVESDAVEFAAQLLEDSKPSTPNRFAFLGPFGCGKSCFAEALYIRAASAYLAGTAPLVPVLLLLSQARNYSDAAAFLESELRRQLPNVSIEEIRAFVGHGAFVLILDGLDEMPRDSSLSEIRNCFAMLEGIHSIGIAPNKTVLTSRDTFFRSQVEEGRLQDFSLHSICTWGAGEWRKCLRNAAIEHLEAKLSAIYSVESLLAKPYFVKLIVENHRAILDLVKLKGQISATDLYALFLNRALSAATLRSGSVLSETQKRRAVQQIAMSMFLQNETWQRVDDLRSCLQQHMSSNPAVSPDSLLEDVINNTLFERTEDAISFQHKSVMEYLVAESMSLDCKSGRFENLEKRFLYTEVFNFAGQLMAEAEFVDKLFQELEKSTNPYFISNALVLLRLIRSIYKYPGENRLTGVLLRNLDNLQEDRIVTRYPSIFSLWRCPYTPELGAKLISHHSSEPFRLGRRVLWHTLRHFRNSFDSVLPVPPEDLNDCFEPEITRRQFRDFPSAIEALLAVNLTGDRSLEEGPHWIVQVGTSLFLSSYGDIRLLPAMLRDLHSSIPELRENALICIGNLHRHQELQVRVESRIHEYLTENRDLISNEVIRQVREFLDSSDEETTRK